MESFFTDILLKIGLYMVPVTFVLMVLAMLLGTLKDPKGSLKFIIGFLVIGVIFFLAYSSASPEPPAGLNVDVPPTAHTVKMVYAGIITLVTSILLTIAATIGSSIVGLLK